MDLVKEQLVKSAAELKGQVAALGKQVDADVTELKRQIAEFREQLAATAARGHTHDAPAKPALFAKREKK